jgi:hypothetical protein
MLFVASIDQSNGAGVKDGPAIVLLGMDVAK